MLENVSRRSVLAWTAVSASRVFGAAERIRLGVIGSGGRGQYLMRMANQAGGVQWVAICDAWDQRCAPSRLEVDGQSTPLVTLPGNVLVLPRGQHLVVIE